MFIGYYIKHFFNRENFTLSSNVISDVTLLDLSKYYTIGKLNTKNTISDPKNGGINNCPIFPVTVYKQI
mgnify:CR=1 FL=1